MVFIIAQFGALAIAGLAAVVRSLVFAPGQLTDFALDAQVKQGKAAALAERRFRNLHPTLLAVKSLTLIVCTILLFIILATAYDLYNAVFFAFVWLVFADFLSNRDFVAKRAEKLVNKHRAKLLVWAQRFRPWLKFLVAKQDNNQGLKISSISELQEVLKQSHCIEDEARIIAKLSQFADLTVNDLMIPASEVVRLTNDDVLGPVLLDKIYKSKQSFFPVLVENEEIIGILRKQDTESVKPKAAKYIADVMQSPAFYIPAGGKARRIIEACLITGQYQYIVIDEFEQIKGIIDVAAILEYVFGKPQPGLFIGYQDIRAVAKLAAKTRQMSTSSKNN